MGTSGMDRPAPGDFRGIAPRRGESRRVGVRVNREAMDLPGSSDDDTGAEIGRARRARGSPRLRRQATGGSPWTIMGSCHRNMRLLRCALRSDYTDAR
jgi:hypothetical protein